tara:strand:- start:19 stop:639 length:621 start_codon:yes stop_codon:yes gene_type:complete
MSRSSPPLVLVHGLWDKPSMFNPFIEKLEGYGVSTFAPYLPHDFGRIPITSLAKDLDEHILKRYGKETTIDLFGFSMGGLISRTWLQKINGAQRTRRFISVGSPHNGTVTAQFVPSSFLPGVADMKRSSEFLKELNNDISQLKKIDCSSFYCLMDLMVIPGWQAALPIGRVSALPVLTHKGLIQNPKSIEILLQEVLMRNEEDLNV